MGRARIGQIVHYSGLSARQVRHGLFILIQLRFAVSSLSEQDGLYSYEPCPSNAYAIVRSGKILQHVNERFSEAAVASILYILTLGHASVNEISQSIKRVQKSDNSAENHREANGEGSITRFAKANAIGSEKQVRKAVKALMRAGYVVRLFQRDFQSKEDVKREAERLVRKQLFPGDLKGQKDQIHLQREIRRLRRLWRDQGNKFEETQQNGTVNKRSRNTHDVCPRKRRRLINSTCGVHTNETSSDSEESTDVEVCSLLPKEFMFSTDL